MRAAITLLVLLFSISGVATRSSQVQTESQTPVAASPAAEVSTQLDDSDEQRELRDMVVELRAMLSYIKMHQGDVKALEAGSVTVKTRLAASEAEVANLKKVNEELLIRLAATETELQDLNSAKETTVTEVEDLKMDSAVHEQVLAALKTRLAASETDLQNLEKEIKAAPKVAFSAALTDSGFIESGSNDLNLVFRKVITNVGQAYSSQSGFFRAPVRGVYYFRFTVMDKLDHRGMSIWMFRNGQRVMGQFDYDSDGEHNFLSGGLSLQLEQGDEVNMVLQAGRRLFDDANNYSTFSGFLLFPL